MEAILPRIQTARRVQQTICAIDRKIANRQARRHVCQTSIEELEADLGFPAVKTNNNFGRDFKIFCTLIQSSWRASSA